MLTPILIFIVALTVLLVAAQFFTRAAEQIGGWLKLSPFVIGVFIVGIGTSLPELISGIISTGKGLSEIVPGNIIGASISNILLITGLAVVLNKKSISLNSTYIYIDLHFLLGSFFFFYLVAYDGVIRWTEAISGILIFLVYSFYLIRGGEKKTETESKSVQTAFPVKALLYDILPGENSTGFQCTGFHCGTYPFIIRHHPTRTGREHFSHPPGKSRNGHRQYPG